MRRVDAARTFRINDDGLVCRHGNSKRPQHDGRNGDDRCVASQPVGIIPSRGSTRRVGALCTTPSLRVQLRLHGRLCRARACQCEGVLAWERARREFQPRLPATIFVDERELPVCLRGLRQSYSDGFLLAQIAHRQLSVLPSEMLIGAARKGLIVTFEMVDDHGVVEEKLPMAGTADETEPRKQQR